MKNQQPSYTRDAVFQTLKNLCERAGMQIQYTNLPDTIYARSRGMLIQMPSDERFNTPGHAAAILGHEFAHSFVNEKYEAMPANPRPDDALVRYMQAEAECDHLGAYLYMLAKRIAMNDASNAVKRSIE